MAPKNVATELPKMLDTEFLKNLKEEDKIIKIQNENGFILSHVVEINQLKA